MRLNARRGTICTGPRCQAQVQGAGLQGEVEQISMMKPRALTPHDTSLLDYLEDIIGTDKYITPIEDAAKQ